MKDLLKILLGFLPWILFGILAGPSLDQAGDGPGGCFGRDAGPGIQATASGVFLDLGQPAVFLLSFILVAFLKNLWVVEHMDLLARATLAAIAWGSIIAGRPFTLQYARESVPEAYWQTPEFIHTGYFISMVWGIIFLIALGASLFRPYLDQLGQLALSPARHREHVLGNHLYPVVRSPGEKAANLKTEY